MKLFLCGGGSGKQINFALNKFSKLIDKNKPILYIPLAMNDDDYDNCESWFSSEINFLNTNKYEMVKSSYELSQKNFNDYSSLFIGGGNNYSILCHFNNSNFKKNKKYLTNYSKNKKTIYLPEEDVIIISDDKLEFIGKKKYIIFKDGTYFYHNFANIKKDIKDE